MKVCEYSFFLLKGKKEKEKVINVVFIKFDTSDILQWDAQGV